MNLFFNTDWLKWIVKDYNIIFRLFFSLYFDIVIKECENRKIDPAHWATRVIPYAEILGRGSVMTS
jgi:hypothetical protein